MSRDPFADESLCGPPLGPGETAWTPTSLLEGLTEPQRAAVTHRGGPLLVVAGAGLGQDARAHAPHRAPAGDARRAALGDPGDHLHQQGGRRDAPARRRAGRARRGADVGARPSTRPACGCCGRTPSVLGLPARLHHLRRGRRRDGSRARDEGAGPGHQAAEPAQRRRGDRGGQERDARRRGLRRARRATTAPCASASPRSTRSTSERLRSANAMDFDDLLDQHRRHAARRTTTCSSTYRRRFRHLLVDEFQDTNGVQNELVSLLAPSTATSAWSATPTSRSTASARPTCATSCSSSSASPTPRSWCSSRTSARPRRSSTRPTR